MQIIEALGALAAQRCFILYRLFAKPGTSKLDKVPVDPITGHSSDAQDPGTHLTAQEALMWADMKGRGTQAGQYGVGIVISENSGLFCIDLDDALEPSGQWSAWAVAVCQRFPGAARELSASGRGLHILGRYTGTVAPHGTKLATMKTEAYTKLRFIALTGICWDGDINSDHTAALGAFLAEHFPPRSDSDTTAEWTTEPVPQWRGPADDTELVNRALSSHGAASVFGGKASFRDLWTANADKLAHAFPPMSSAWPWDRSGADMALAAHLAFWTGSDCERMARLMRVSGLVRDKWQRDDYFQGTILRAAATQRQWYKGRSEDTGPTPTDSIESPPASTAPAVPNTDPAYIREDRSAQGNANLLIRLAGGNLRYVHETKQWLRWDGQRWQIDTHEVFVTKHALQVAEHYLQRVAAMKGAQYEQLPDGSVEMAEDVRKWAVKSRSKGALDDMIALARKVPGVPISVTELDKNPWLLGVDNGVVDLRTGELRETEAREDYVTKRCSIRYNPAAQAPRWQTFIDEITGTPIPAQCDASGRVIPGTVGHFTSRPELARYLHKALGLAITGVITDQLFFFAIGEGSNGKGVVFDTVKDILGPYARSIPASLFLQSKNTGADDAERPTAVAATLAGARMAVATEVNEGQYLNGAAIKSHTGDKEQVARRMRENPFTFTQTHKVWLQTNVEPRLDHIDAAIRGRLHLVPFDRRWNRPSEPDRDPTLPDGDKTLLTHLRERESEGILAWLVRGALLYQQEGLRPPAEVTGKTRTYFEQQDHLGRWLATLERCNASAIQGTKASTLYAAFAGWCTSEGCKVDPANQKAFGMALDKRKVPSFARRDGSYWGLLLSASTAPVVFGQQPLPAGIALVT